MKIEVGKCYSCRDSCYFGKVYKRYDTCTQYVFAVEFYNKYSNEYYATDSVTKDGIRFCGDTDYLDLVAPLGEVYIGELR